MPDLAAIIIAFENDELDEDAVIALFSDLVRTGLCWQLQGFYGRSAATLIQNGVLDEEGNILDEAGWAE
jgi:hypothetical protein